MTHSHTLLSAHRFPAYPRSETHKQSCLDANECEIMRKWLQM